MPVGSTVTENHRRLGCPGQPASEWLSSHGCQCPGPGRTSRLAAPRPACSLAGGVPPLIVSELPAAAGRPGPGAGGGPAAANLACPAGNLIVARGDRDRDRDRDRGPSGRSPCILSGYARYARARAGAGL
jgi:hypothetical protein